MIRFFEAKLENGLTVIAEVNPEARSAAMGYFVRTGARDERKEESGVSHFLEHMVFKGPEEMDAYAVNLAFDELGAQYNAFTSEENTVYYGAVLPELLPELLTLFTKLMRPALREADFEMERKVILEEIALYEDRPDFVAFERARERYFRGHPLANRVLGTLESIRAMTREQMVAYHARRYVPGNMVLAFAGRLDWERVLDLSARLTEGWRPGEAGRDHPPFRPEPARFREPYARARQTYLVGLYPGFSARDERRYVASVLASVLGDAGSSRLHWALVDKGLVEQAGAGHEEHDELGTLAVYATTRPENRAEVAGILEKELDRLASEPPTEEEIARAKTKAKTQIVFAGETPMKRLFHLGLSYAYTGRYEPLSEVLRKVEAVRREDVAGYLAERPFDRGVFFELVPGEG